MAAPAIAHAATKALVVPLDLTPWFLSTSGGRVLGSILARVTHRKALVLLTVLLATSGTLGCKKLLKRKLSESMQDSGLQPYQGGLESTGGTAGMTPEEENDQKLSQKLDAYVK